MTYTIKTKKSDFSDKCRTFFKNENVLVLGGSGFVGSHAVEQLITLGATPYVVSRNKISKNLSNVPDKSFRHFKCDINDQNKLAEIMEMCPVVLNLAANVGGIEYNKSHPASIFRDNIITFINSIEVARQLSIKRYLVTSSACVYPRECSIPTPEVEGFMGIPEPTNAGYGWAKRMEEFLGENYCHEFQMNIAIARPYNCYGPRDNFNPKNSHVIPALIKKAFECDGVLNVWGDGKHTRSFLYVEDFSRGILEVAACAKDSSPINIGADQEVSIATTAKMIARIVGKIRNKTIRVEFDSNGTTGQPRRKCDTKKAKTEIGFEADWDFECGLERTIEWYNYYENRFSFADKK